MQLRTSPLLLRSITLNPRTRIISPSYTKHFTTSNTMSSTHDNAAGGTYSTANTGEKHADPYKAKNMDVDVSLREKVEDLLNFVEGLKFGMMTTRQNDTGLLVSRCMALAARENGVDFIFHTNTETGKTDELMTDPHVNLGFIKSTNGEWASISGTATIETDREIVKKHYSPSLKAWVGDLKDGVHDGGPNDPRIGCIRVKANTATYALQKGNAVSRGIEVAKGAVTGSTANTNKLREITATEFETFRTSNKMID